MAAADARGGGNNGSARLKFLLKPQRGSGSAPIVMWLVARAARQLRTRVEIGGAGGMAVEGGVAKLQVMETKTSLKGAAGAEMLPEAAG